MDHHQFLKELEEAYSDRGLELSYSRNKDQYILEEPALGIKKKGNIKKTFSWNKNPVMVGGGWLTGTASSDNPASFNFRVFGNIREFVYHLALRLSRRIGRLPDALHARMIMSTDDDRSLKEYVRKHGR